MIDQIIARRIAQPINFRQADRIDKAVKDYKCTACDLTIFTGEYIVRREDGNVRHPNCLKVANDLDRQFESIASRETPNELARSISYFAARPSADYETAVKVAISKVRKAGWVYGYDVQDLAQFIYCKLYSIQDDYPFEYMVVVAHNAAEDFRRQVVKESKEVPTDLSDYEEESITTHCSGKANIKLLLKEYLIDPAGLPVEIRLMAETIYESLSELDKEAVAAATYSKLSKVQQKRLERIAKRYEDEING